MADIIPTLKRLFVRPDEVITRNSPENPATSLSRPAAWLFSLFGQPASSGVRVTGDTALSIAAVYRAIRILAEGVAGLQGGVYRDVDGSRIEQPAHWLNFTMREPSPLYTGFTWREAMQAQAALRGNGISLIRRNADNQVIELRNINPDLVETRYEDGVLLYMFRDEQGNTRSTTSDNVLHIPALVMDMDTAMGKSPLAVHRETLGLNIAMTQYAARTFKNGAHISGFLTTEQKLSEEAAMRMAKSWKERFSGVENAGKTPVLEEGLKFQPLSMTPEDARFIESARLGVEEVARIFGVPLHMLGNLERATFSNIEHQSREFVMYSLRPWVKRWEEEINRKLFTESEKRRGIYWRFNLDSLLRGDSEARAKLISEYMKWGILTRDEVRRLEGFNDSSDTTGDKHYVPVNMVPAEMAGQQNQEDEQQLTVPEQ